MMVFHDLFTHGEPDAGAAIFGFAMEAFEDGKDLFGVFLGKANAVVGDVDVVLAVFEAAGDAHDWGRPVAGIFEGIGNEVGEQLGHLVRDSVDGREWPVADLGLFLLDEEVEFRQDIS